MCMSKINTNETKPKQVNEAKTVENIKFELILSCSSDFIYRALQQEK